LRHGFLEHPFAAFERGKHVVTANKEVVAKEWAILHEAARVAHRELRFEAAVGGAVPVIRGLRELQAVRPRVLRGLVNGTTTYICSQLESGVGFDDALAEALKSGHVAGAALDVFETEPLPPSSPLWGMGDRVILTPHIAGYSPRIAGRHLELLLDNVRRFVRGETLVNIANKAEWF